VYEAPAPPAAGGELPWSTDARERMSRVPAFARTMVTRRVEAYCRERGIECVTPEVLVAVRARLGSGPPFSKRGFS
jgi:hypothetical protein